MLYTQNFMLNDALLVRKKNKKLVFLCSTGYFIDQNLYKNVYEFDQNSTLDMSQSD